MGGPKSFHGEFIEGSFQSHQVPLPEAKSSPEQLAALQNWLSSYHPERLFDKDGVPVDDILNILPEVDDKKLGQRKAANANYSLLDIPQWTSMAVQKNDQQSCMKIVGEFLHDVIKRCAHHQSFVASP